MVISVKETTVFSVFHPDAQDLFNTCSDLKKVAWELWDPSRRLDAEVGYIRYAMIQKMAFTHILGQNNSTLSRFRTHAL
jgi:hypothetical protein